MRVLRLFTGNFPGGKIPSEKELAVIFDTEPPFPSADSAIGDPDNIDYERGWKRDAARFETGALNLPGIAAVKTDDPAATCEFLNRQKVRCVVREGYLRLGMHGYSTKDEIDQVCVLLKEHAAG